jgi:hypothetical protein
MRRDAMIYLHYCHLITIFITYYIARSNEILAWEGVGNRQLLCFFQAYINWGMLIANLKFRAKKMFLFFFLRNVLH